MTTTVITNLDEFSGVHDALSMAIENAELKNAEKSRVDAAKTLRRKLISEASLMRAVEGQQKTTIGHILMLEELTTAAKGENANEDLLEKAKKLIAKKKSEREVQHRIAEAAPLCELSSWKDTSGMDAEEFGPCGSLPEWSMHSEDFQKWHDDYKEVF